MKSDRPQHEEANAWTRFWFTPTPSTGFAVARVLSGLLFCGWVLSFLGHQAEFLSLFGFLDARGISEMRALPNTGMAPIGWSIFYLAGDNATLFQAIYWLSLFVLVLFTLGIATRITGVLTWIVVISFLANPAASFEGDYFLAILAFYMALGHLLKGFWNGAQTPAALVLGSPRDFVFARWLSPATEEIAPSSAANFTLRLLQIHVAIIVVTSALHKLQIAEWWSGVAFWFPLHPPFQTTPDSLKAEIARPGFTLFYLSVTQYAVLAWQLAFPAFAWREGRAWRVLLIGGAVVGWLGAFFLFKLPLFGPFFFIGALSYLRPEEWTALVDRLSGIGGRVSVPEAKVTALSIKK